MRSSLIDTLFLSDKRKNLLLLLLEGPQTSDDIKEKLDVNWGAMIPQIKKMQEWNLLKTEDRVYSLTDMGRSIAINSKGLLGLLDVYENNYEYLSSHDLKAIPENLLNRIGELNPCHVVESDLSQVFVANSEVIDAMINSKKCVTLTSFYQPQYNEMYNAMIKNGCDMTFIYTEAIWERVKNESLKDGINENDSRFLDWKNCRIYVIPNNIGVLEVTIMRDTGKALLGFFDSEGRFESRYLLVESSSGCEWADEFLNYVTDGKMKRVQTNVE